MRLVLILLVIVSISWPAPADAFTSGLFQLLKVGGNKETSDQTTTAPVATSLNLIVEAETYTPHFYRGRAEPTAGSTMRLIAMPGNPDAVASYRWRVDGQLMNASGQTLKTTTPTGTSEVVVDVSALDQNGNVIGQTTDYIPLSNPSLSFYEVNPLRGISNIAIRGSLSLIGDEVTVRGEPYFINPLSLTSMSGRWNTGRLDNIPSDNWRTLTILRTEDVSNTRINLETSNLNTLTETLSNGFILEI